MRMRTGRRTYCISIGRFILLGMRAGGQSRSTSLSVPRTGDVPLPGDAQAGEPGSALEFTVEVTLASAVPTGSASAMVPSLGSWAIVRLIRALKSWGFP